LAILPLEALQATRQIRIAGCLGEKRAKLVALVRALQTLITRISQLFSGRDRLLEITEQILKPQFERLEIEFKQMLDASRSVSSGRLRTPAADGPRRFDRNGSRSPTDSRSQHVGRPAVRSAFAGARSSYHATADVEGYLQVGDFSNDHASTGMIQTSWSMVLDGIWSDKPVLRTMRETGLCDLRSQLAEENDPKLKAVP
jgi:hypothetical protein